MEVACLRQGLLRYTWRKLSARINFSNVTSQPAFVTAKQERSKVPQHPVSPSINEDLPPKTEVDLQLVQRLEKLSLVDFVNKEGLTRLEAAIRSLPLAEDEVHSGDLSEELLACAQETLEDYFVVPPGNITYSEEKGYYRELDQGEEDI
ncbi:glutamyl-tRNA(Gln) amidotransferase subunit C, mitochondrial isoform X2 [Cherax quadricarinatus]|nr:glutamyl-tRNA(Gln) amidotransferase subunit C, mitochondrial-like isoform X2 [Cherax quadricarinatus]